MIAWTSSAGTCRVVDRDARFTFSTNQTKFHLKAVLTMQPSSQRCCERLRCVNAWSAIGRLQAVVVGV